MAPMRAALILRLRFTDSTMMSEHNCAPGFSAGVSIDANIPVWNGLEFGQASRIEGNVVARSTMFKDPATPGAVIAPPRRLARRGCARPAWRDRHRPSRASGSVASAGTPTRMSGPAYGRFPSGPIPVSPMSAVLGRPTTSGAV